MSCFRVNVVCAWRHVLAWLPTGGWHWRRPGACGQILRTASSCPATGATVIPSGWEY